MAQRATSRSVELDEALSILMEENQEQQSENQVENKEQPAQKTEAQDIAEAKKWGEELAKMPKEKIKIKSKNSKDQSVVPGGINGYFFCIKKDEVVQVPEPVADILREADYI